MRTRGLTKRSLSVKEGAGWTSSRLLRLFEAPERVNVEVMLAPEIEAIGRSGKVPALMP